MDQSFWRNYSVVDSNTRHHSVEPNMLLQAKELALPEKERIQTGVTFEEAEAEAEDLTWRGSAVRRTRLHRDRCRWKCVVGTSPVLVSGSGESIPDDDPSIDSSSLFESVSDAAMPSKPCSASTLYGCVSGYRAASTSAAASTSYSSMAARSCWPSLVCGACRSVSSSS